MISKHWMFAVAGGCLLLFVAACEATTAGEACDEFFKNSCKAPLSCVDIGEKKVCAASCDWLTDPMPPHHGCKDPALEPAGVEYTKNGTAVGGAGCHCLPKEAAK